MNRLHLLFGLLLILFLISACGREDPVTTSPDAASITASVITVSTQRIPEMYTTTGSVVTDDRIELASRLMGFIRDMKVREGSTVSKGQLLLTIDPTEIQALLAEANARLAQAKAHQAEVRADLERHRKLYDQQLIAANQFTKVQLQYDLAVEELRVAEASLARIKVQLQYAEVRSPVDGIVVSRHQHTGDMTTPGSPILTIENPANILVETFIREDHLKHINTGDQVRVTIDAVDLETTGVITRVVPAGDPATHSYQVKATLNDMRDVRSGMFARIAFALGDKRGFVLPASALVLRADIPGVYIVDDENIAHFRMVRTGRSFNGDVEILAGIEDGDRVMVSELHTVKTGDRIIINGSSNGSSGKTIPEENPEITPEPREVR